MVITGQFYISVHLMVGGSLLKHHPPNQEAYPIFSIKLFMIPCTVVKRQLVSPHLVEFCDKR